MVKQRFSSLDVGAMVVDLKGLVGLRLQNVYDINPKTFLLKFAKPDLKELLLIESGVRMHTTEFNRDKSNTPSGFATKLRKHLRTRRLCDLRQIGTDRMVDLRFGDTEHAYHLILEFYSSGNIILTDHEYRILALLRTVDLDHVNKVETASQSQVPVKETTQPKEVNFRVGEIYSFGLVKPFEIMTEDKLKDILDGLVKSAVSLEETPTLEEAIEQTAANENSSKPSSKSNTSGKSAKGRPHKKHYTKQKSSSGGIKDMTVKKWIRDKFGTYYGPTLVEHAFAISGVNVNLKVGDLLNVEIFDQTFLSLMNGFTDADKIALRVFNGEACRGWITQSEFKSDSKQENTSESTNLLTYDEFHPHLFAHLPISPPVIEFPTFNKACDEFYSHIEAQKLTLRARQAEALAQKKLDHVRSGHQQQVQGLERQCEQNVKSASAIEANLQLVEAVLMTIRSFVAAGMDWIELGELVKEEAKKGNQIASCIAALKLDIGMVTIALMDPDFVEENNEDDDEGEENDASLFSDSDLSDEEVMQSKSKQLTPEEKAEKAKRAKEADARRKAAVLKIDIDIYLSAFANARRYYDSKKVAAVKVEKTIAAASKAFKSAEKKITQDLKQTQSVTPVIRSIRKPFWFEKFIWFISSENYLVVGGRDATQNDILVKKYLGKADVFVHSDIEGAACVIIKNPYDLSSGNAPPGVTFESPIPPLTLHQAGTMSVAHSKAWDSKIVTSAFWVKSDQVSRITPHGDTLPLGTFWIKGHKYFLPPVQLIYGFGLLFRVDESCKERHFYERRPWGRHNSTSANTTPTSTPPPELSDNTASIKSQSDLQFDKYALEVPKPEPEDIPAESLDQNHDEVEIPKADAKKRVSAKERRDMKKQASGLAEVKKPTLDQNESDDESEDKPNKTTSKTHNRATSATSNNSGSSLPSNTAAAPRGKKGKLKKMKNRYADQDDEDRELMMDLLKSKGQTPKEQPAKVEQNNRQNNSKHQKSGQKASESKVLPRPTSSKDNANDKKENAVEVSDFPEQVPDSVCKKSFGTNIKANNQDKGTENYEEGVEVHNCEEDDSKDVDLSVLDFLTGQPHPEDTVISVIPVCAPWTCLGKYKYKAKLIPGPLKKGKAAKSVMNTFETMSSVKNPTPFEMNECELIKGIPEVEVVSAILSKIKIMGGEGATAKGKVKKGK